MRRSLHDAWWRLATGPTRSPADWLVRTVLDGASVVYGAGVGLRNAAYDRGVIPQTRLTCPVVSVGNLSVGGTGKTSCVEFLAQTLTGMDKRACILSRGYGGSDKRPYILRQVGGQLDITGHRVPDDELPDEPQLLAWHLADVPVVVGARRSTTGRLAVSTFHPDVILLDDGFQHRRLARDCEIVLVNARMPLSGWPLLPRGPMREPLASLRRADILIITKVDQAMESAAALRERLRALAPQAAVATAIHEPTDLEEPLRGERLPLDRITRGRVSLLSSIGDPEGFEQTVRQLGATILAHQAFPDHHRYRSYEWQEALQRASVLGVDAIVTTEKDLVRLRPWLRSVDPGRISVWVLRVRMRLLSGADTLHARLAALWRR
jgi:tetraacyldisaccharide 4'-kinase